MVQTKNHLPIVELVQKFISETEKGKRLQNNGKQFLRKSII